MLDAEDVTWLEPDTFFVNCLPAQRVQVRNVVVHVPLPDTPSVAWRLNLPPYHVVFKVHDAVLVRADANTGGMWRTGVTLRIVGVGDGVVDVEAVERGRATHAKLRLDVGMVQ